MFKPFLILNLITLKFYNMNKQIQKSQISIGLLMMCVIAMQALLFSSLFSSCKKNAPPVEIYYTVTFNSQGGSAVSPITEVKPGSAITLPASPTKAGSTFDGWCTDKEGKYLFLPTTPIYSDFTLYAKWGEQFYTVTFDSKGGSAVNPVTGVKYGSTITLPDNPVKTGFTFGGWCADKGGKRSFSPTTTINSDLTLYAKWMEQLCTVTFDSKGGSAVSPTITEVKYGTTITLPPAPTKDGFVFSRWCLDDNTTLRNQFNKKYPITANLTLYAKWLKVSPSSGGMGFSCDSFSDGSEIPAKHIFPRHREPDYLNITPALSWANAPAGTNSFLVVMQHEYGTTLNWGIYDLPDDIRAVYEGTYSKSATRYHGPDRYQKPRNSDSKQTYIIMLFALDVPPDFFLIRRYWQKSLPRDIADVEWILSGHILAKASIKGIYTIR